MNAYLMAAGNGMRLRPMTDNFQKCLLPVFGKPMLEHWLEAVFNSKIFNRVFVNIHHCGEDVKNWLSEYFRRTGNQVTIIDERSSLLGTAGTLLHHGERDQDFMLAYTDTFSKYIFENLRSLKESWIDHMQSGSIAGLISFTPPEDGSAGAIKTDGMGNVTSFIEKSDDGYVVWAGTMFASRLFYDRLNPFDKDIARDVLPRLIGRLKVIAHVEAYDIGRGIKQYEQFINSTSA